MASALAFVAALALACMPAVVSGAWEVNLDPGVTEISRAIFDLHMTIFWICVAIACLVFGVMLWAAYFHRKSRGAVAKHFHENTFLEILWTLIPIGILVLMAVPATATLIKIYDPRDAELDVLVTGYQWRWRYQYLDQELDYFSNMSTPMEQVTNQAAKGENYLLEVDRPLVLPVGKKIRFLLTSNDVIHSWWVPAIAVKQDAIPGFVNEAWTVIDKPGIYRGQCAELCGQNHAFMPIVLDVREEEEFAAWLSEAQAEAAAAGQESTREWTMDELMARGEEVYNTNCAACHQVTGAGVPPVFPALVGSPVVTGDIAAHEAIVLQGKAGTAMQSFASQLSAADLAAVITYERNAWGNNTGDLIQPSAIAEKLSNATGGE
ncbi:cytochrome c oxidase subunit II [Granulosicoccaceae sp. 1_MG-2023]|nr:cytochrome c oxidase subunit II [Granulosicoccaceae sp. 1_MG-2023]